MEKKLEQKALVGSARVLRFPDKEFALKRAVFFMRSVYPHFKEKKKQTKSCCECWSHPAKDSQRNTDHKGIRDIRNAIPIQKLQLERRLRLCDFDRSIFTTYPANLASLLTKRN